MRALLAALLITYMLAPAASAVVIGHAEVDAVASLPQATMDKIGGLEWFFSHASVGTDMLSGMAALQAENPTRYQFTIGSAGDRTQIFPPPTTKDPGTIYDGARGNPGWAAKFAMFDSAVRDMGWRYPAVEVAMDKLCYIDAGAEVNAYLAMMTALERDFPATRFVYLTMPLQSTAAMDASNMTAMNYNQVVRAHCAAPRRVLLDIADIESHDPAGNPITFTSGGDTYQRLWSGYTYDGGHLNAVGARRAALGWYAVAAAIVTDTSATPLPADPEAVAITSIAPNPVQAGTTIRFRLQRPGSVRLSLYDVRGREVAQLIDADLSAGDHVCHWDARDAGGRRLSAGMYFARLQGGAAAHSRRFALVE